MNMQLIAYSSADNEAIFDLSTVATDLKLRTTLSGQAGQLRFYIQDPPPLLAEKLSFGSMLDLKINNTNLFKGYVFTLKADDTGVIEVTAFDQLRYLKNKDFYCNAKNEKLQDIFSYLCEKFKLKYAVQDTSAVVPALAVNDNKTLYKILENYMYDVLVQENKYFVVRDEYGTLTLSELKSLYRDDIIIGENSLMSGFRHTQSIDRRYYNQIKLSQENENSGKRDVYQVYDSEMIKQRGVLQYYETVGTGLTEAQIKAKADALLKVFNKVNDTLDIVTVGDDTTADILLSLKAGNGFILRFTSPLVGKEITKNVWIIRSEISIIDGVVYNSMDLDLMIGEL